MEPFTQKSALVVIFAVALTLGSPVPQQYQDQDVYRAFSPGQYAHDGQPVLRTAPRLVAIRAGQTVRAHPGGTLKRVRVAAAPQYAVEQQLAVAPQQQAYYVQRQPAPLQVAKAAHVVKPAPRPAYQSAEEPEEEYASDPNPQYNFSFDVKDDDLTNYQNRQEERDGGVIKGSYSVVDPDGYVRTVTYTADPKNGFQAKVVREPTDVKVKFPVPTQAPEEQQPLYRAAKPVAVKSHHPQQQVQYHPAPQYSQQPIYHQQPTYAQPTYVVRRIPAGAATVNQPRVVKVLRAQ